MEELENSFLEEIRPLIEEYKKKTDMPKEIVWNDKRGSSEYKEDQKKKYENSLEGELLQELDETTDPYIRKELIEQIKEIRQIGKEKLKEEIYNNTKKFIRDYREKANSEIGIRKQRLEKFEERRKRTVEERIKYKNLKTSFEDNGKIYKVANEEEKRAIAKIKVIAKMQDKIDKEMRSYITDLEKFEAFYGKMDFSNEYVIYNLESAIGRKDVKETIRVEDEVVKAKNTEIKNMGKVIKINDEINKNEENEQKPEEQKPEGTKPEEQKTEEQKPEEQKPEEQKSVKMPISNIKIDASKGIAIAYFTNRNREPVTYQIDEIMKNKKTIKWINRVRDEEISKQDRKQMMKKANPVIVKILADYNQEEDYDMLKAYYNNIIGKDEEEMQQPKVDYSLKGSKLSWLNNMAIVRSARNEENSNYVVVDRNKSFKEKFNEFIKGKNNIKTLMQSSKKEIKNKATTLSHSLKGLPIAKQLGKAKQKVTEQIGKTSSFFKNLREGVPTQEQQSETSRKFNEEEIRQETMEDIGKEVDQIMQEDKKEIVKADSVITNSGEEIGL